MMYVVPHGDRLDEYDLPAEPVASAGALSALGTLRKLGAPALGLGVLAAAAHYLAFGPETPDDEEAGS
jgi:hypothetical protein